MCDKTAGPSGSSKCEDIYDCCDCGGYDCGCYYCWSCNACEECLDESQD